MRELTALEDDGLVTPVVGDWADDKYRLVWCCADIFTSSMKEHWDERVYIDFFAGPGRARIRGTKRIVSAPPLLALDLKYPFTKYIFSEFNPNKLAALRERVARAAPHADTQFVLGDTNANIADIIKHVPKHSSGRRVLTFCYADPYRLRI